MRSTTSLALAVRVLVSAAIAAPGPVPALANPTATDPADVHAAAVTATSLSPTSLVKGKAFDRWITIWFENIDYDMAAKDRTVAGDYFGLDNDNFHQFPESISTVFDLRDDKKLSWGVYSEDIPYTGYQGFSWVNQKTGANDYVRKHNPAILFNSVTNQPDRLAKIKNQTLFYEDLANDKLPQWIWFSPNMTDDGYDTSVTVAGNWLRQFLSPLLSDPHFMSNTLVFLTFDENEHYATQNRVFSVLLGDAVPVHLQGTTDSNFYNHYSEISTVEANWGLHTLGRHDVGANVFHFVAEQTGDLVRPWAATPRLDEMYFNTSYPGIFNSETWAPQLVPNVWLMQNGRTVLPSIVLQWLLETGASPYTGSVEIPDGEYPPIYPKGW